MSRLTLFFVLCAFVCVAQSAVTNDDYNDEGFGGGRGLGSFVRNIWDYFFGEEDYDYYDYDESVSSYVSYDPHTARRDHSDLIEEDEEYSWGEIAAAGSIAAAIGAALLGGIFFPPQLFTLAVKKRSFEGNDILERIESIHAPFLRSLQSSEFLNLMRPECQKKLFCEMSQLGKLDESTILHRSFYYISHLTPDNISRRFRVQRLFEASRQNQCENYFCPSRSNAIHESPSNHLEVPVTQE